MRTAALLLLLAGPVAAQDQRPPGTPLPAEAVTDSGALNWLKAENAAPLEFRDAGALTIAPGGVVVADPLTFSDASDWPFIPVPEGDARFIVALDVKDQRVSKALLLFSDDAVVCGADVATVGVDTGLAAFYDREMVAGLDRSWKMLGPNEDLYNNWFHELIGDIWVVGHILPLPDGTRIPMSSSGWGDGSYPVATLRSGTGEVVAIYADFMGRGETGEWLLPPPCVDV